MDQGSYLAAEDLLCRTGTGPFLLPAGPVLAMVWQVQLRGGAEAAALCWNRSRGPP